MKTIIAIILLFSSGITACGYELPEQEEQKELKQAKGEELEDVDTNETADREPPASKPQGNSVEVNVNVEVNQYNGYAEKWLFQGAPVTWAEANRKSPDAYRLATRAELLEAYDNGEFDGVAGLVVWSATELVNQPGYIVGVNLGTGTESRFHEGIKLHVVYILR